MMGTGEDFEKDGGRAYGMEQTNQMNWGQDAADGSGNAGERGGGEGAAGEEASKTGFKQLLGYITTFTGVFN